MFDRNAIPSAPAGANRGYRIPFPRVAHRGGDSAASTLHPWLHSYGPYRGETPRSRLPVPTKPPFSPRQGREGCSHGWSAVRRQSDQAQPVVNVAYRPPQPRQGRQRACSTETPFLPPLPGLPTSSTPIPRIAHRDGDSAASTLHPWLQSYVPRGQRQPLAGTLCIPNLCKITRASPWPHTPLACRSLRNASASASPSGRHSLRSARLETDPTSAHYLLALPARRIHRTGNAEPEAEAVPRRVPTAERRPAEPGGVVPAPAASHAVRARARPARVVRR